MPVESFHTIYFVCFAVESITLQFVFIWCSNKRSLPKLFNNFSLMFFFLLFSLTLLKSKFLSFTITNYFLLTNKCIDLVFVVLSYYHVIFVCFSLIIMCVFFAFFYCIESLFVSRTTCVLWSQYTLNIQFSSVSLSIRFKNCLNVPT